MSSHNLTSIAVSREVHSQLSKIGKMHQSYNDVVKTLITEYWEKVNNNTKLGQVTPARVPETQAMNSSDTSLGVDLNS